MCRWLAYTGSPVLLTQVLYTPVHSLIDQSLHSRLGAETTNGDGFGVGWYDSSSPVPGVFRSIEPAWNDQNLRELAGHIRSALFFAHIRAAIGSAVQQTNCHPFRHDRWLFMHNGFIDGFAKIKRDLVLDIMLPGRDGLSVLRQLRDQKNRTPVLLLSARGQVDERAGDQQEQGSGALVLWHRNGRRCA